MSTCNRLVSTDYAQNSPLISVPLSDFSPAKTSFSATHWHSSEMTEKSYVHQQSSMCYQYPAFKCSCLYLKCTYSLTQLRRTYATFFEVWILSRTNKTTESSRNHEFNQQHRQVHILLEYMYKRQGSFGIRSTIYKMGTLYVHSQS